ncbi:addiction module antidote protein, HigA family [Massilia arenosa]|uniref:Addiction module antidote protein, HigA family n=1 Tax=Zemynaea arenosa TaxID=2561931 RepID=A0A4Y9SMB9_9BURK|nr:HigA family addiction module antitoxin [Massilia arenosa]TFW25496.1 addiction module antidote protein, HigA family [Massilia arenosa]
MLKSGMRPVHPGEILREEYLIPLSMSPSALAGALRLTASRVNEIVREKRGITPDTALRLARYFGTTPEFWLDLQTTYSLRVTAQSEWDTIVEEVQPFKQSG